MRRHSSKLLLLLPIPVLIISYALFASQPASVSAALKACRASTTQTPVECESKVLTDATKTQNPTTVMRQLIELASMNTAIASDCHQLGHNFGVWAYEKFRQEAVAPDLAKCSYGYYHGLLKGAAKITPLKNLAAIESELCRQFKPTQDQLCAHGVGHALGDRYDDIHTLLTVCSDITINGQTNECFLGATMTWGSNNLSVDPAIAISACEKATTSPDFLKTCVNGVLVYSQLGEANYSKLITFCPTLPSDLQPNCYAALGSAAINPGNGLVIITPAEAAAVYARSCDKLAEGYPANRCALSFASGYLVDTQNIAAGRELCSMVKTHRSACEEGMEYGRKQFIAPSLPNS